MIGHALLVLYRSLARHRLYAALNVFGLAAGIAVFLVLLLVVRYERSYDRYLPHADQVYRLDTTWTNYGQAPVEGDDSSAIIAPLLQADFPQVTSAAREMSMSQPVSLGNVVDSERVVYADPDLLDVLEFPLVAGDRAQALATPTSLVVSESAARKYFGTTAALGRQLTIAYEGIRRSYTVSAVMRDLPPNSTVHYTIIAPFLATMQSDPSGTNAFLRWGSSSGDTYLRITNPRDAATINANLRDFVHRRASGAGDGKEGMHPENRLKLRLIPLLDTHFRDGAIRAEVPGADRRVVMSLFAVGVMALLTAAINYVNLATARAGLRAREVALRKVVGATRRMLVLQFLGEAIALVAVAALIGLAAAELAVPAVNALGGWAVKIDYLLVVPLLLALILLIGLGAGCYPALLLAGFRPAAVLASARTPAGGRMGTRLRNLLVLVQFVSAIAFAICTLVIDAQATLLRTADRGFERDGLIIIPGLSADELRSRQLAIMDALRRVPGVAAATVSDREPNSDSTHATSVTVPGLVGPTPSLIYETVGQDYDKSYGLHMVTGRWFDKAHRDDDFAGDARGGSFNAVINRAAVPVIGAPNPNAALGRIIVIDGEHGNISLRIVGVVQDIRFTSPREKVAPQFYVYESHSIEFGEAAIRFSGVDRRDLLVNLKAAWQGIAPDNPFVASAADERLAEYYKPDQQRAGLFSVGAVLAIGIACIGLYGLASFSTARRMKEIGIRKVLGASTRDVLALLVGQFVRPVLIANIIAWPIAFAAMRGWLAGFDERVSLSPMFFLAASAIALLIAILTVLGQAWRVAQAEPARALRYE